MADSNYIKAVQRYRDDLRAALVIADDPFKAPEQTVETSTRLLSSIWEMRVQYAALGLKDENA